MKTFSIEGKEFPALILGSSPFCGAGQFGEKAQEYHRKFFMQPSNITDLLVEFCKKGYSGAHLLAYPPLVSAALSAYEKLGYRFPVIITIMPGEPRPQWESIKLLNTVGVFLHARMSDNLNFERLKRFTGICRERGVIPGFATHNSGVTIPAIDNAGIDAPVYLCPFNKTGGHVHPSLQESTNAILKTQAKVIGMKVLSCGQIPPEEALEYAMPYVDAVAVGMVTKEEIEENCRHFEKYSSSLATKRSAH
jgi:hypothetical protein